jgi:hypothetical protein
MATRSFARSLYWRIGLGFILFLAITLVLQVALFIYVAGETEGGMPERMGRDFAELVASDFESALARDPQLNLRSYAAARIRNFTGRQQSSFLMGPRSRQPVSRCRAICASPGRFAAARPAWHAAVHLRKGCPMVRHPRARHSDRRAGGR